MAAIYRDSVLAVVAAVVVRTRPRAIPLAMITMRKSVHGLLFLFYMGLGLRLAALGAAGAPLLLEAFSQPVKSVIHIVNAIVRHLNREEMHIMIRPAEQTTSMFLSNGSTTQFSAVGL